MSALALVAFIGSFFVGLVGVICGHIALSQLKKTRERGYGFALAGVIIGYATTVFGLLMIALVAASVIFSVTAAQHAIARTAPTAQPAPVSQADITTVTTASAALSTSIDSIAATMIASPVSARDALMSAEETFKASTSTVSDQTLQDDLHYVNEDLTYLSADLSDYMPGDAGTTESQLGTDISTLKSDVETLKADCG